MGKTTLILIILIALILIGTFSYGIYFIVDWDYDGIVTADELRIGSNPFNQDTDNDGLTDYDEVYVYKTNPLSPDSDGDGLADLDEITIHQTDPLKRDTDGDGLDDYSEIHVYKTNPLVYDTDGDNLTDYEEVFKYGTNPLAVDSDGDGLNDSLEIKYGSNPLSTDSDNDGISDYDEAHMYGTLLMREDSDGDGLSDYDEIFIYKTDPLKQDTDGDGITDYEEVQDSDGDGLINGYELEIGTKPFNPDTDGDGVIDSRDIYPLANLALNITLVELRELARVDVDSPGDPYVKLKINYVVNNVFYSMTVTVPIGVDVGYVTNFWFTVDIPDNITDLVIVIMVEIYDNDTIDGLPVDYAYSIWYLGEQATTVFETTYTIFSVMEKNLIGPNIEYTIRIETVQIKVEE